MAVRKIAFLSMVLFLLGACTTESKKGDITGYVSSFINNNDKTAGFGSAGLKGILNKTDYKSNDKLGLLLGTEMGKIENVLDIDGPIFFVAEGPFSEDGAPDVMHMFMAVKNLDSLKIELESRSFNIEKAGDVEYADEGDFLIGMNEEIAIVTIQGGDYNAKKIVKENFKMIDGDLAGGTVDEILALEGDMVFGMHLENLYNTSNTDIQKLDKKTQQEVKAMMKGSFVSTNFKFEDGAAVVETKNYFSDALKDRMFLNADAKAPVLKELGSGTPRAGMSINIDMKKMQAFMDEFSPDATKELARSMGGPAQMALMAAGSDGLSGLFKGQFGGLVFLDQDDFGATPDFNFFVGLTTKGNDLGKMGEESLKYFMENVELNAKGLNASTNAENSKPGAKLNLPKGCEDFGKSGVSLFVNLDGLDMNEFDLDGEENLLRVIKYVTIDYNNDGGKVYVKAKKGQENILKQALDVVLEELISEIGNISI